MQLSLQDLTTLGRQGLPLRQKRLTDIALLLWRHLLPDSVSIQEGLFLFGRQIVPCLQILANLRLALRAAGCETARYC